MSDKLGTCFKPSHMNKAHLETSECHGWRESAPSPAATCCKVITYQYVCVLPRDHEGPCNDRAVAPQPEALSDKPHQKCICPACHPEKWKVTPANTDATAYVTEAPEPAAKMMASEFYYEDWPRAFKDESTENLTEIWAFAEAYALQVRQESKRRPGATLRKIEEERDRYLWALRDHLCDEDMADWISCSGGHREFNRGYCPVCYSVKLEAEVERLRKELAALKRDGQ